MRKRMICRRVFPVCVFLFCVMTLSVTVYSNEIVPATDVHMIDFDECDIITDKITDSYGNDYSDNVIRFDAGWNGYASFDLNGEYSRITGAFVASDDTSSDAELYAAIFVDGVQCFAISKYTKQQPKQEFDIDLSGACRLDIKTSNIYECNGRPLYLVDTEFEKSEEVLPFTEWYSLRDTVLIDSDSYEETKSLGVDSFGELHNGSLRFDASHDAYALFNLNKQYDSFSASLAPGYNTSSDIKMDITIYCDDNVVFSKQGITRLDPETIIDLDVSDVGVLRVETDAEYDGNYEAYLYIYDDILK